MKGLRLSREQKGSSFGALGAKKRADKQQKQKQKEDKTAASESEEIARAAPFFVDACCENLDVELPLLTSKLLGCGYRVYLGTPDAKTASLEEASDLIWGIVGTLPARRADKLSTAEHQELLNSVADKPGVCAVVTGVEYGKPPHGENIPCAVSDDQKSAFEVHVKAALKWKVPIMLVIRPEMREEDESERAVKDTVAWLSEFGVPEDYKICFSSWMGSPKMALMVMKKFKNSYFSFNAAVTFRSSSNLREVAFDVPAKRFLLESSAPHFPPMNQVLPHSPWTILSIVTCVAEQRRISVPECLAQANENASTFFGKVLRTIEQMDETEEDSEQVEVKVQSEPRKKKGGKNKQKASKQESHEDDHEEDLEDLKKYLE